MKDPPGPRKPGSCKLAVQRVKDLFFFLPVQLTGYLVNGTITKVVATAPFYYDELHVAKAKATTFFLLRDLFLR